jgi:hypothetical protein
VSHWLGNDQWLPVGKRVELKKRKSFLIFSES